VELHSCGGREPGQALFAMRDDVLLADPCAGCSDNECLDCLAPLLIGHADHGHFGDLGQMRDTVLDPDRRHVVPAGDDHILLPVRDRQVAFIVDRAAVAGVEPLARQRFGGRLGVLPIAVQYDVRTDEHLSEVGHLHLYAECGCAGASQLACAYPGGECGVDRARPVERDDRRRLGQTTEEPRRRPTASRARRGQRRHSR